MAVDPAVVIMLEVGLEIRRACEKHGHYLSPGLQHGISRALEELGEFQREVNLMQLDKPESNLTKARAELVQLTAVCHMMLTNITEGRVEP